MTTNTPSQSASIDTPEFRSLMKELIASSISRQIDVSREVMGRIISGIDATLAQAHLGKQIAEMAADVEARDRDEWKARARAVESRLAEIQRGVEGAEGYWRNAPHYDEVGSSEPQKEFFLADDIRALLQPQGQADTSGLPG